MQKPFRGFAPPAEPSPPVYDVVSPGHDDVLDLTILDTQILGTPCHWVPDRETGSGRSVLCLEHEGDCPRCGEYRSVYLGWLACLDNGKRRRVVLRVGPESALALAKFAAPHFGLRGVRVMVRRATGGKTRALSFERHREGAAEPLPQPHGLERTVCMVLGCERLPDMRDDPRDLTPEGGEG